MRDRIISALRQAKSTFTEFTIGQKATIIIAIIALAVGGYFFAVWSGQPTYAPLFTNLAPADASAIVDKLTAEGISYQLADGGSTILVPKEKVYSSRIKLSASGLPSHGDAGYALLDKQDVMTSEFMQQVSYRRALEGELAKTIKAIDGVTGSTVHLAIPKKDVFADEQQKTTASVLVATAAGKKLSADQVQAIVHLVASSVEGLDPEQVTVVGSDGAVLSSAGHASVAAGDMRSRQTREYEQRMNTALQRMLDQAVGPNHSVVQVTADLDFDATETKTQKYVSDPNNPPLSEQTKTESYTGTGTPTGGVLGPDNIQVPGGTGGGTGTYEQSTETKNNAVGVVSETRKSAPGSVRKLSIAVLLDNSVIKDEEAARLRQLITSAAGIDANRGDTIAVSAMKFDTSAAAQAKKDLAEAAKAESMAQLKYWIETGAIILGILALLIIALLSGRKKRTTTELTSEEKTQLDEMQAAIEAERLRELEGPEDDPAPAIESTPEIEDPEYIDNEQRRHNISLLIDRQPEEITQLLRSWLADRRV